MDKKSILSEIKKMISFSSEENKEMNFLDAKANNGEVIVRVEGDSFEVGMPLYVVGEEGVAPAPAGEHILEDGTRLVVDEAGVLTAVEAAEEMEDDKKEEVVVEEMSETEEVEETEVVEEEMESEEEKKEEELEEEVKDKEEDKVAALESRIEEMEKVINEMLEATKETANFSSVVLEKLESFIKDTPAELTFNSIKTEYKRTVQENKENKFSGLEAIKNIRRK